MSSASSGGSPRGILIIVICVVIVAGIVGLVIKNWSDKGDSNTTVAELTAEELVELVQLKNRSVGYLENSPVTIQVDGKMQSVMDLAAEGFDEIGRKLPDETLPWQNLAICHWLTLANTRKDADQRRGKALAAIDRLLKHDPKSAVAYWLKAKTQIFHPPDEPIDPSRYGANRTAAVKLLAQATRLDTDNPVFWFALYQAAKDDPGSEQQTREALEKAYSLAPNNLYLITEWLLLQMDEKDPSIVETLEHAQEVIQPLHPRITQRASIDVNKDLIDPALAQAREGNLDAISGLVRQIQFVVRPEEVSKSDLADVDAHALEFVVFEFSEDVRKRLPEPGSGKPSNLAISWEPFEPALSLGDDQLILDSLPCDFDLDGSVDLVVLLEQELVVFARSEQAEWQRITAIEVPLGMRGIIAADLDRDSVPPPRPQGEAVASTKVLPENQACHVADMDLVVYGAAGIMVLRNDFDAESGNRTLTTMELSAGLEDVGDVFAARFLDFDHDGDLDLLLSSDRTVSAWLSMGPFKFHDASQWSQMPVVGLPFVSLVPVDWDRDVDIDVMLCGRDGEALGILENLRHGQFRWRAFAGDYQAAQEAVDLAIVEADGNASWDLVAATEKGVSVVRTSTPRPGTVNVMNVARVGESPYSGVSTGDIDNDGFQDIVAWIGSTVNLMRGLPGGEFAAEYTRQGFTSVPLFVQDAKDIRDCALSDLDNDGDLDLIVTDESQIFLINNGGGNDNYWINIFPMGQADNRGRCNHNGIGSLVELKSGTGYQAQVVDGQVVHFGLGQGPADVARIVWTNGQPQDIVQLEPNTGICELMVLKGSCPYLYTWDGEQFAFLTDCLWAAPLGLQVADGQLAPSRPWEYLRIPGGKMRADDGFYRIKLTEELWEAGYFDHVQLIVVDHPEDVDIFSNEKVGPAEIAAYKIHTVRHPRMPVGARDQRGRDVLPLVKQRDGEFLQAFEKTIRQGLAPPHYLELDLGQLEESERITLFLTGWIYPTDTSLNVGFSQDPEIDGPQLPSIWVPNDDGKWQQTRAYMGFPGGKTKTIAVDLSDVFLTNDYRLRIQTTAEIYWDHAFFTVDEAPVPYRTNVLDVAGAELSYRGFSAALPGRPRTPVVYDHQSVSTDARWAPMQGMFTRYGDVTELLRANDAMMVVMGAGDAMEVRFPAAEDPPPGWKRDFLLYSVGWDKDADLNTVYGQSSEPLPFSAMKGYPYRDGESYPETPQHKEYLRKYQNRRQPPAEFWKRLQNRG